MILFQFLEIIKENLVFKFPIQVVTVSCSMRLLIVLGLKIHFVAMINLFFIHCDGTKFLYTYTIPVNHDNISYDLLRNLAQPLL